jgi:hypothetical protein
VSGCRTRAAGRRRAGSRVAQRFHLLQEALKLVLASMELPGETRHVRPSGQAQVPQHEIGEIGADP